MSIEERKDYWLRKFPQLRRKERERRLFTLQLLDQLDRCKSEEAQRIILGVSR